jgi:hypothetical protein
MVVLSQVCSVCYGRSKQVHKINLRGRQYNDKVGQKDARGGSKTSGAPKQKVTVSLLWTTTASAVVLRLVFLFLLVSIHDDDKEEKDKSRKTV